MLLKKYDILGRDIVRRVSTPEKLNSLLHQYKDILQPSMMEYLNSLINLEFSVVKSEINEKERNALSNLPIYDQIAIYNIYQRAISLFKESQRNVEVEGNDEHLEGIIVYSKEKDSRRLFEYEYIGKNIPDCGAIRIFQYGVSRKRKEEEIERLREKLKYTTMGSLRPNVNAMGETLCGANSLAISNYEWKVKNIKERIDELKKKLYSSSSDDKKIVTVSREFTRLLLEDYGLKPEDFVSSENNPSRVEEKAFVRTPKLTIVRNTKYI